MITQEGINDAIKSLRETKLAWPNIIRIDVDCYWYDKSHSHLAIDNPDAAILLIESLDLDILRYLTVVIHPLSEIYHQLNRGD